MEKAERERVAVEQEEKRLFKQELAWMRAGVQARGTKQQARIDRFQDLKKLASGTNQWHLRSRLCHAAFREKSSGNQGRNYAIDHKAAFERLLIYSFKQTIELALLVKTVAGKSTLLNILAGRIPLESGLYSIGETVRNWLLYPAKRRNGS